MGLATAKAFAVAGAAVALADVNEAALRSAADETSRFALAGAPDLLPACCVVRRVSPRATCFLPLVGVRSANRSPYCTAKWGLIGFTKTLSIELGEYGIRANAILPGAVDGPRIQRVFEGRAKVSGKTMEQIKKEAMSVQSLKRLVDPKDIAALAVFLASWERRRFSRKHARRGAGR
jgi:NAD(P)-dependent dehydrogenase (short-subunit alcohol dehydrogenase family)